MIPQDCRHLSLGSGRQRGGDWLRVNLYWRAVNQNGEASESPRHSLQSLKTDTYRLFLDILGQWPMETVITKAAQTSQLKGRYRLKARYRHPLGARRHRRRRARAGIHHYLLPEALGPGLNCFRFSAFSK
jgi:hypothetical protein